MRLASEGGGIGAARRAALEQIYARGNRREFVHPDPLEFLYQYRGVQDREIAGFVASSLAYGRVAQILKSVEDALSRMGPSPRAFVERTGEEGMRQTFKGFKHRFTTGGEMARLLIGAKRVIARHGSLHACFLATLSAGERTIVPALGAFADELSGGAPTSLLPRVRLGSACKRMNLFLRWMVRRDDVDPGGWGGIGPSKLVVPLDTHMYRIGRLLGFTERRAADMRTALEITSRFAAISPHDPVKYDFALTRAGINDGPAGHKALANLLGIR